MSNFCKDCGHESSPGAKFCIQCGTQLGGSGSTTASSASGNTSRANKPQGNKPRLIIAAVVVASLVGGGVWFANYQAELRAQEEAAAEAARFEAKQREVVNLFSGALKECGIDNPGFLSGFEVEAKSLSIDGKGKKDFWGADYSEIVCVIDELGMPASTRARWGNTRALDGQLEASWSGPEDDWTINAYWSYHPDRGPDVVLELESEYLEGYVPETDEDSETS
jgi:uncharacterized OB-fold protein